MPVVAGFCDGVSTPGKGAFDVELGSRGLRTGQAAVELARATGDAYAEPDSLNSIGCALAWHGDVEAGIAQLERTGTMTVGRIAALTVGRIAALTVGRIAALTGIGIIGMRRGDPDAAAVLAEAAWLRGDTRAARTHVRAGLSSERADEPRRSRRPGRVVGAGRRPGRAPARTRPG